MTGDGLWSVREGGGGRRGGGGMRGLLPTAPNLIVSFMGESVVGLLASSLEETSSLPDFCLPNRIFSLGIGSETIESSSADSCSESLRFFFFFFFTLLFTIATRSLILDPSSSLEELEEEKPKSLKSSVSGGGSATGARVGSLDEVWSAVDDSP